MIRPSWWNRWRGRRGAAVGNGEPLFGSQPLYQLLAELAQDQIFVISRDDRVEYVNRNAAEQFNTVPERLIGRYRHEIFPPHIAEAQKRSLDTVFQTGRPLYVEGRARYQDREVWLGTWLAPVTNGDGSVTAVLGSSRDITERKHAEETLRETERRLQAVVSNIPLVLWTTDQNGTVTFCAGQALAPLGLRPEDVTGRPFDQTPFAESVELRQSMEAALAGDAGSGQMTLRERTWATWCAPQRGADGTIGGVLGLLVDVTERRRLEEHLAKTQTLETLGRLAGGIAHDFNNHLTAILGYIGVILVQAGEDSPISTDLIEIQRAGQRAAGLVRRLLAFGRRQVVQPHQVNLNEVVNGLWPMLERLIGEHIQITIDLAPELFWINGDTGQLEQILMNLALNARDAMPNGGTLKIRTWNQSVAEGDAEVPDMPSGQYAALVVSDSGRGMDASEKDHLFEPFFTTKPIGEGTGLGLSTVYGIVKQFGGFIFVDSAVGRGTTLTLYWPVVAHKHTARTLAPGRPAPPAPVAARETILLVEDEETVRRFVRLALEQRGFQVVEAGSAKAAHAALAQAPRQIHLLVTDVVMPGDSGVDLAAQLKRERPELPVLFMSGYPANLIAQNGMIIDPDARILRKPFTFEELLAQVEAALGREPA